MKCLDVDVAVLGSGFAGSLTAMILKRVGLRVALIDRARHPRFAIGESSTPIANRLLHDLATRYDLPRLLPLCKYGTWQQSYPEITSGLKRGFSYFAHAPQQPFTPDPRHRNELLVAASSDDEHSDTQWLRADVDRFLCAEAYAAGVAVLEECAIEQVRHEGENHWAILGQYDQASLSVRASFVIDGTGEAGLIPRRLGIVPEHDTCRTHSRAIFSHFHELRSWTQFMNESGGATQDHPFDCDHAAQHHILDGAWMWVLRFNNGVTSAGFVLDSHKHPLDATVTIQDEWEQWLERYPSVAWLFADARLAAVPGGIKRTGRLQRRWNQVAGSDWALLAHTAGFIDPLHSTGIAHSLCSIERLVRVLTEHGPGAGRCEALREYHDYVRMELDLIDELVASCFACFGNFELLTAFSMLYFAAATTYEHARLTDDGRLAFLCANRADFRAAVRAARELLPTDARTVSHVHAERIVTEVARIMAPFNQVGLFDRAVANMYRNTVAPF